MIVISAGMMKSASTIVCDYEIEIMKLTSRRNGQFKLLNFSSSKVRAYRGKLDFKTCIILILINYIYGDIVLKSHSGPTIFARLLMIMGIAKVSYTYRDPRDAVLSMMDHGERTRKELLNGGQSLEGKRGFRHIYKIEDALPEIKNEINNCCKWKEIKGVLLIRYENFIENRYDYINTIASFLERNLEDKDISSIYQKYEINKPENLNKGTKNRYIHEMNEEEVALCNSYFLDELNELMYSLK